MPAKRAMPRAFLRATIAITFISLAHYIYSQQCHTAHDEKALKSLQERADAGDADAQCGLGKQYEFALGVPEDDNQAAFWLQKSGDQGDIHAQVELGVVFDRMQDYAQALIWYETKAQYNLGACYVDGLGVNRDQSEGYFWVFLAGARTTDDVLKGEAENTLESLATVMKKGDIKNAQKRAQAWLKEHPRPLWTEQMVEP